MSFDVVSDDVLSCTLGFCGRSALYSWCLVSRRTLSLAEQQSAWARLAARLRVQSDSCHGLLGDFGDLALLVPEAVRLHVLELRGLVGSEE